MSLPFYTIGHSNRSLETFIELLRGVDVRLLADIRKMAMSRANPQFNREDLSAALARSQISYEHMTALAGLRGKARQVAPEVNAFWTNRSFHNYADYALSQQFQEGLSHLLHEGRHRCCAVMCAESVWWRCHRRIVADYLIGAGETVFHIMDGGRLEPAILSSGARPQADGSIVYPALHAEGSTTIR